MMGTFLIVLAGLVVSVMFGLVIWASIYCWYIERGDEYQIFVRLEMDTRGKADRRKRMMFDLKSVKSEYYRSE